MTEKKEMTAKELVNIIFPKHDRSSCSDEHIDNGINSVDEHIRCSRCALLSLIEDPQLIKLTEVDSIFIDMVLIKKKR